MQEIGTLLAKHVCCSHLTRWWQCRLQDRDTLRRNLESDAAPKCLYMSSHFVSKLCQERGGYNYENVRRWMGEKKLRRIGLSHIGGLKDLDKVIVPVHLGNHWVRCCQARGPSSRVTP